MGTGKKQIFILLTLVTVFGVLLFGGLNKIRHAKAVGITVNIDSPANGEFSANTDTNVTFRYTASQEFSSGATIKVTISPALNSAVSDCSPVTDDVDGDTVSDGSFGAFSTTGATYTFTSSTTQATTNDATMCLNFQNDTSTRIYSLIITDSNNDYGGSFLYVGDDNNVTVTAVVSPSLAFAIRNSSDSGDTNICNLGALSLTTINTCAYRLKVTTNAVNGYTVQFQSNGDLRRSGTGDVADSEDLDYVIEDDPTYGSVAAGTEGYGIGFSGGQATGGTITEAGNFNDDDSPIPLTLTTLYTSNGPNNPTNTNHSALMTHKVAMDADTNTGDYQQIMTYYASASF